MQIMLMNSDRLMSKSNYLILPKGTKFEGLGKFPAKLGSIVGPSSQELQIIADHFRL